MSCVIWGWILNQGKYQAVKDIIGQQVKSEYRLWVKQ